MTVHRQTSRGLSPLLLFFVLAYAITWLMWLPLVAAAQGWTGPASPYWHLWGSLGPMLAAFLVVGLQQGQGGLARLFQGMFKWRVHWLWWAAAVLGPLLVFGIAVAIAWLMGGAWPDWSLVVKVGEYPALGLVGVLIAEIVFYGYGEEVGWRGFALPYLQRKYSVLWASVIISVFWAIWHFPLFFVIEGYRSMGLGMILAWYLSMLTGSILTTWLFNSSGGSILLLAIFHGLLDVVMVNQGVSAGAVNIMGMLFTLWGLACLFAGVANLARRPKVVWEMPEQSHA